MKKKGKTTDSFRRLNIRKAYLLVVRIHKEVTFCIFRCPTRQNVFLVKLFQQDGTSTTRYGTIAGILGLCTIIFTDAQNEARQDPRRAYVRHTTRGIFTAIYYFNLRYLPSKLQFRLSCTSSSSYLSISVELQDSPAPQVA